MCRGILATPCDSFFVFVYDAGELGTWDVVNLTDRSSLILLRSTVIDEITFLFWRTQNLEYHCIFYGATLFAVSGGFLCGACPFFFIDEFFPLGYTVLATRGTGTFRNLLRWVLHVGGEARAVEAIDYVGFADDGIA